MEEITNSKGGRPLTPRRAAWLVLRPPAQLGEVDHHHLAQLTTHPSLAEAVALAQDFAALVRQRQPTHEADGDTQECRAESVTGITGWW